MALWFDKTEFDDRQNRVRGRMAADHLDGLLLFKQESMYYLTGYDTDGFVLFQTLFFGTDGRLALLTRSADRYQAEVTSIIEDVRVWVDAGDQNPVLGVKDMLQSLGMAGKRIGWSTTPTDCQPNGVKRSTRHSVNSAPWWMRPIWFVRSAW